MDRDTALQTPPDPATQDNSHRENNLAPPPLAPAAPLKVALALVVGFLVGVFVMFVLRTEMRHLRDSAAKFAILLGLAVLLGLSLLPLWFRLRRLLHATFQPHQAEALLHSVVVLLWAGVIMVTVVCGLLFLAVQ